MQFATEKVDCPPQSLPVASFSSLIKRRAIAEGFEKVGIIEARRLDVESERLDEWLHRGYHANMTWLARSPSARVDPRSIFPAARSIVVVAINYYTPAQHHDSGETGKVSRYAWGDDYHQVVRKKLSALLDWIKQQRPDAEGKICVDIQSTMDKAWAVRAGLGWLGKHSNVITPEYGSWVFIGELLLDLDLDYETEQIEDHCGTCTLCIDACPTQAIVEPYVVDSAKCISYATIELRDPKIPSEVGEKLSGWLYGCDICQDVCPWNRFEQVTKEQSFQPRDGNVNAELEEIVELTHDSYVERFRGSAMKRAKLTGLQRNARELLKRSG
ncbi:MAG TPA: tRNA epoxyqueuosine(34) reductase QueG [Pyrinomonadaceae bacterium]|nr:tRNA epoxyqueuosine(34) reductase QueG [Pyrinomonadaceae bacterium]